MGVFKEMNENIPMVDFASVIRTTVMVYMTLPRSIQREFSRIDTLIEEGTIQEGYDYCSHPFHYEITAEELERLKRSDWKNLVFVDVGSERGVNGSYSMHSRQIPRNATKSGGRRFITLVLLDELSIVFAGRVYQ